MHIITKITLWVHHIVVTVTVVIIIIIYTSVQNLSPTYLHTRPRTVHDDVAVVRASSSSCVVRFASRSSPRALLASAAANGAPCSTRAWSPAKLGSIGGSSSSSSSSSVVRCQRLQPQVQLLLHICANKPSNRIISRASLNVLHTLTHAPTISRARVWHPPTPNCVFRTHFPPLRRGAPRLLRRAVHTSSPPTAPLVQLPSAGQYMARRRPIAQLLFDQIEREAGQRRASSAGGSDFAGFPSD